MVAPLGVWGVELNGVLVSDQPPYRWGEDGPEIFGWSGVRDSDIPRPAGHGVISRSPDYFDGLSRQFPIIIDETTEVAALERWEQLAAAWTPSEDEQALSFATPLRRYTLFGRPRRCEPSGNGIVLVRESSYIEARVEFFQTDPYFYGDALAEMGTTGAVTGGFVFPHAFPQGFGAASIGGVELNNVGNAPSRRLTVRIEANAGPVDQPKLELLTTGETLDFDLVIPDGSWLDVDFTTKRALLNGTSSRTGTLRFPQSRWPAIPPGVHTLRFTTSGAEALLIATFMPAWLS